MGRVARVLGLVGLLGSGSGAEALTFEFSTVAGDTLTSGQAAAFSNAAAAWSARFSDAITVRVQIGFRALGGRALGQTTLAFLAGNAAYVTGLAAADARGADDALAVASLTTATGSVLITSAQAKALGATSLEPEDGVIEFSSSYSFSEQRNADGTIAAGTYDLVGVAEHEIGHVLGFASALDADSAIPTLLDEFRWGAAGRRGFAAGAAAYFSIDGGVTDIVGFSVGGAGHEQASHWISGTNALMDPTIGTGVVRDITPLDLRALDVLGYDRTEVAEPGSLGLVLAGVLAALGCGLRGKAQPGGRRPPG